MLLEEKNLTILYFFFYFHAFFKHHKGHLSLSQYKICRYLDHFFFHFYFYGPLKIILLTRDGPIIECVIADFVLYGQSNNKGHMGPLLKFSSESQPGEAQVKPHGPCFRVECRNHYTIDFFFSLIRLFDSYLTGRSFWCLWFLGWPTLWCLSFTYE